MIVLPDGVLPLTAIVAVLLVAAVPAAIARTKGREFWLWWSYATLFLPVALVHAIVMKSRYRRCHHCGEQSAVTAGSCWNCGRSLDGPPGRATNSQGAVNPV